MKALIVLLALLVATAAFGQVDSMLNYKGNPLYRAKNDMSGNLVRTVFYNYGLVGNIPPAISGEWPIGTGNEYVGDVSPLVGVEFIHPSGDTLVSVCTSDGPRGNPDGPPGGGAFWGFEPLPGFSALPAIGEDPLVAVSNQKTTWPPRWPDKSITDSLSHDQAWVKDENDPGWPGSWNGYFGKNVLNADQESYFQMDDQADLEWFERFDSLGNTYYYYPHAQDTSRRGLGLRVSVRGLQWAHFLAQDVIFWLYEITNVGTHTYDKVAFGMVVGTLSGGRQDSEDDLAYFDLENDITYSFDSDDQGSPGWVPVSETNNVGYVGYAFLESPGNPVDGIDNDGDSQDPDSPHLTGDVLGLFLQPRAYGPGEAIVLIDYDTYERTVTTFPTNGPLRIDIRGRELVILPGQQLVEDGGNGIDDNLNGLIDERIDHRDLAYVDYITGRGLDDVLLDEARDDGIDNDGDWDPLTDDIGADGVPLTGDFGEGDGTPTNGEPHFDKTDVDESDQIGLTSFEYFSPPGAVRMRDDQGLWERMTPGRFDVVSDEPQDGDFIYGSGYFPLRPGQTERFSMALAYGQDLQDITDNKITVQQIYNENYNFARPPDKPTMWAVPGDGQVTLYWDNIAEASFDPVTGYDFEGYKIYRSTDPGFNEVFTITDGLGRKVFHRPIEQFDLNNGNAGFFPVIRNSVIYYLGEDTGLQNAWTDTTVENGQTYYYAVVAYDRGDVEKAILPAENTKTIIVDASGRVTLDINTAVIVPRAPASGYEEPQFSAIQHLSGSGTGSIAVETVDPRLVADHTTYRFDFEQETDTSDVSYSVLRVGGGQTDTLVSLRPLVPEDNLINQADRFSSYYDSLFNLFPGTYDPAQYFRVAGTDLYDGQRGYILIPRQVALIQPASGWADTTKGLYEFRFGITNYNQYFLVGESVPGDFVVEWEEGVVDTSEDFNWYDLFVLPATPVDFRIRDLNTNEYLKFAFDEQTATTNGVVDNGEVIIFMQDSVVTWALEFRSRAATGDTVRPTAGDFITLKLYQPYSEADAFEYNTTAARIDAGQVDLDRIKVYPNPYVAANPQEPSNPFNEGRGERRLTFNHLPERCTIRIYTVKGELVDVIEHNAGIDDGTENWDLRTSDGLNVAYGIYLYHVDSPYGEKTGRFAVIK
ncbi:MAG: hypothetical protein H6508_08540 [Calditrichaeota bacterium]|nr:hypothetical protein [Calditrichota bacterium]